MLVLYHYTSDAWKLGDFGLTAEGTSKKEKDTFFSRGTQSYRAPELVQKGRFSNRTDIWAVGCIFYELIYRDKALVSDIAVHEYTCEGASSGAPLLPGRESEFITREYIRSFVERTLLSTLDIDRLHRPSATDLHAHFGSIFPSLSRILRPFLLAEDLYSITGRKSSRSTPRIPEGSPEG